MEKSLKRQIVEATEAVKKKVRKMKDIEINNKEALESVFKPVTEPLNLIANVSKQSAPQNIKDEEIEVPFMDKTIMQKEVLSDKESNDTDDYDSDSDSDSSYKSIGEKKQDCNTTSWSVSPEALADIPFGVRYDNGKLMLGSARIIVNDEYIIVADRKYRTTPGLKQLLLKKNVDSSLVTEKDMQHYKLMLLDTNAHRRDYDPNKPIKSNKGLKYLQIIKPLFLQTKGKGLPLTKMWKKNVDFIYWDDPNELVERLKLLIASQDAGNTGVNNEIISIIEELRESNIINT